MSWKALRRRLRPFRPRLHHVRIISHPVPFQFWDPNPLEGTAVWLKKVTRADDPHLAQVEPRWRLRSAARDFARGAYCLLAIDGDRTVGEAWTATQTTSMNPFRGEPWIRLAGDEEYFHSLWVDPACRRRGIALGLAVEYMEQLLVDGETRWVHVAVHEDNEASIGLATLLLPMWESQRCTVLRIGPRFCIKVPFTEKPRFGPLSRRGRHSGHGDRVYGRPAGYDDKGRGTPTREGRPLAVDDDSGRGGPDWF